MRKPRHLSAEDKAIWDSFKRGVTPMRRDAVAKAPPAPVPPPKPRAPSVPDPAPLPAFRVGQMSNPGPRHDLAQPIADALRSAPPRMDAKEARKIGRGKVRPEARLDLHGMFQDEAFAELQAFIHGARAQDKRLVLVITGKGRRGTDLAPQRAGVLRHQVPMWLRTPAFSGAVLDIRPAHVRDGGDGAYYVRLRKRR